MNQTDTGLTLVKVLSLIAKMWKTVPIIYYYTSEHAPEGCVYKLPNSQARAGYDLAFHPSLLDEALAQVGGGAILRPMDDVEIDRRRRMPTSSPFSDAL